MTRLASNSTYHAPLRNEDDDAESRGGEWG
jgi:hypothetical protein